MQELRLISPPRTDVPHHPPTPFELLIVDYLSLLKGKGGYHTVLLILDTYSRFTWEFKLRTNGTAKTTLNGLKMITHTFCPPETLMTAGGSHFNNSDVHAWCKAQDTTHHVTAAYAPWINGLVENANGKLLGLLKCLCSPGLREDDYKQVKPEDITRAWPDHFNTAICQLNEQIIPSLQFSPKELLLGFVVNTTHTPPPILVTEPTQHDVTIQTAYIDQQRLDGQVEPPYMRSNERPHSTAKSCKRTQGRSYSKRTNSFRSTTTL